MSKSVLTFCLGTVLSVSGFQVSPEAADSLYRKIDDLRAADNGRRDPQAQTSIAVSETEMESFVLYEMEDEIPPRVDSIDVVIGPGEISADTELFFGPDLSSGNSIVDLLLGGSHRLFVGGKLSGNRGQGRFELLEVRVDGVPVPLFLVETLVDRFVKPDYPDVDLHEPFSLPWGIEEIVLSRGEARITY